MFRFIMVIFLAVSALGTLSAEGTGSKFALGGGLSVLGNAFDQQVTVSGSAYELKYSTASWGINVFVDLNQYFTLNLGYRSAIGNITATGSIAGYSSSASASNNVSQWELGGELKYPFQVSPTFLIAPKLGLDYVSYLAGGVGGSDLTGSDAKQQFSPLSITLGADLDYAVNDRVFVRIPVDLDFALNAKLSSAYYSGSTYVSSSSISFRTGVEIGSTL